MFNFLRHFPVFSKTFTLFVRLLWNEQSNLHPKCLDHKYWRLIMCLIFFRTFPHPYITVLENRPDCWPALLQEIDDFLQLATDKYEISFRSIINLNQVLNKM